MFFLNLTEHYEKYNVNGSLIIYDKNKVKQFYMQIKHSNGIYYYLISLNADIENFYIDDNVKFSLRNSYIENVKIHINYYSYGLLQLLPKITLKNCVVCSIRNDSLFRYQDCIFMGDNSS